MLVGIGTAAALKLGDCLSTLVALSSGRSVEKLGTQLASSAPLSPVQAEIINPASNPVPVEENREEPLLLALLCAMPACTPVNKIPPAPAVVATKTVLDEQGALAAELAYNAAPIAAETGVDAGLIRGATAAKIATLDVKAFAALKIVHQAYSAKNAAGYTTAIASARAAIDHLLTITGKTGA